MKSVIHGLLLASLALVVCGVQARAQGPVTNDVFGLKFSGSGIFQNGQNVVGKQPVSNAGLINLARGRALTATVPANEQLALMRPRDQSGVELDVVDTTTTNVLVTIATGNSSDAVVTTKNGTVIVSMNVQNVGVPANKIKGGELFLAVTFGRDANGNATKFKAAVIGDIEVLFTDDVGPHDEVVLLPKASFSSTGLLATVISP